jgi:hypothetical protein
MVFGTIHKSLEHPWNKTRGFRGEFQCLPEVKAIESSAFLERAMGIEPKSEAWEAKLKAVRDSLGSCGFGRSRLSRCVHETTY